MLVVKLSNIKKRKVPIKEGGFNFAGVWSQLEPVSDLDLTLTSHQLRGTN